MCSFKLPIIEQVKTYKLLKQIKKSLDPKNPIAMRLQAIRYLKKVDPKKAVQILTNLINSESDGEVWGEALHHVSMISDLSYHDTLVSAWFDTRPNIRIFALEKYAFIGYKPTTKIISFLLEAYEKTDRRVGALIIKILGKSDDSRVVSLLIKASESSEKEHRQWAIEGLIPRIEPESHEQLISLAKCDDQEVRKQIANSIEKISATSLIEELSFLIEYIDKPDSLNIHNQVQKHLLKPDIKECLEYGYLATIPLIHGLRDKATRYYAIKVLERMYYPGSVDPLINILMTDDTYAYDIINALGKICSDRAIPAIIQMLESGPRRCRPIAAWALGNIGDPTGLSALKKSLYECNDEELQKNALRSIKTIERFQKLQKEFEGRDSFYDSKTTNNNIVWTNSKVLELLNLANDVWNKEKDMEKIFQQIEHFGSTAVSELMVFIHRKPRTSYSGSHREVDVYEWNRGLISDGRGRACIALGNIGDQRAVPALIDALEDENNYVSYCSTKALCALGSLRAVCPLIDQLEKKPQFIGYEESKESAVVDVLRILTNQNFGYVSNDWENWIDELG